MPRDERRWSLFLGDRRRRGPGGQSPFPAATHRSAAEAIARKEEADQPVDLPALDTVSRTAAARTFPIVRAVHRPGPQKTVGCWSSPWHEVRSPEYGFDRGLRTPSSYRVSSTLDPASLSAPDSLAGLLQRDWTAPKIDKFRRPSGLPFVGTNYGAYPPPAERRQLRYPMNSRVAAGRRARIRTAVRRTATCQLAP